MSIDSGHGIIEQKLGRLRTGDTPRVLDLFAGCGGFSLGFHRAGCQIVAGVELDPDAAKSHALNFHGHLRSTQPDVFRLHCQARDITVLEPKEFIRSFGFEEPAAVVDVLVGGPPCPTFTRVGRAKLREIHDHPEAFKHDPRSQLYLPYLRFVEELRPVMLVMENVPDILNYGGHNLAEEICEVLEEDGYRTAYSLLNAANYGVPEMRERFILIGIHRLAEVDPASALPEPQNHVRFPPGYQGARDVALKTLRDQPELTAKAPRVRFVDTPSQEHLDPVEDGPVTAEEAIADLPPETKHLHGLLKKGRRDLSDATSIDYPQHADEIASAYVKSHMWSWPGFESGPTVDRIRAHTIRSLSHRDYRLFRAMAPGMQYPDAYRLALDLFDDHVRQIHARGLLLPDEYETGRALRDACQIVATELRRPPHERPDRLMEVALEHWAAIEDVAAEHDARKKRYGALLKLLRKGARHPEGSVVTLDILERWRLVKDALEAFCSHRRPDLSWVSINEVKTYRRLLEASDRGLQVLGIVPAVPIVPLDAAASFSYSALKKALKSHEEEWAAKERPSWELLMHRLSWGIIGLSHRAGEYLNLKHQFVPPYDPGKFPNKWRKMEPDWPARTLMAHLGKDSYSHIHFDSEQARTISVREAARLQSFPDGFHFCGTMNPAFRQIGNAVPPLFAFAIARGLLCACGIEIADAETSRLPQSSDIPHGSDDECRRFSSAR